MKEQELDKYLGKYIELVDFTNEKQIGILHKIIDNKININHREEFMPIKNGYCLERELDSNICYRKSHIKKISVLDKEIGKSEINFAIRELETLRNDIVTNQINDGYTDEQVDLYELVEMINSRIDKLMEKANDDI